MKSSVTYHGFYDGRDCRVSVIREGEKVRLLDPRNDIYDHSPTGIAWGYGGSGPAQCALGVLADYFAEGKKVRYTPRNSWDLDGRDDPNQKALRFYQDFKRAVIAGFDYDKEWVLTGEQIEKFITGQEQLGEI